MTGSVSRVVKVMMHILTSVQQGASAEKVDPIDGKRKFISDSGTRCERNTTLPRAQSDHRNTHWVLVCGSAALQTRTVKQNKNNYGVSNFPVFKGVPSFPPGTFGGDGGGVRRQ